MWLKNRSGSRLIYVPHVTKISRRKFYLWKYLHMLRKANVRRTMSLLLFNRPFFRTDEGVRSLSKPPLWKPAGGHFPKIRKFSWMKGRICLCSDCFMHGSYLDPVIGLLVNNGDVAPLQQHDDIHHGLHLIQIRGNGPREVLEALFVAQFGTS